MLRWAGWFVGWCVRGWVMRCLFVHTVVPGPPHLRHPSVHPSIQPIHPSIEIAPLDSLHLFGSLSFVLFNIRYRFLFFFFRFLLFPSLLCLPSSRIIWISLPAYRRRRRRRCRRPIGRISKSSAPSGQVLGQSHRAVPVQYQYRCCHGETRGGGSGEIWILSLSAYLLLLLPLPSTCHCLLHITACYKSLPPHTHHCPPSHHLCPNPHPSPRPCALGHVLLPLAASRDTSGPVWHRLLAAVRRTRRNSVS
ncbi:hypothetical protein BZA05DRAFT_37321 [Tricharina praecox]|uniref:uncharacterized protein n=1 Tax=Tricharina praecox TaxID=43433 RepID=UPI00221EA691|nr:uncharacterized protein BZA05DRAFT_37321 [Tricharina praecox]KAI5852160.1 hypothetical protein BZA05DRAFT_37321 [Tricharina praecox]